MERKHKLRNSIIQEARFQKNPLNVAVRMEQNFRKLVEIKKNFNLDLIAHGLGTFTSEEIINAFDGFSAEIFDKELYQIDVLFDD